MLYVKIIEALSQFCGEKWVRIFAYSSTREHVERGWKQRARLGRDAKNTVFSLSPHTPARAVRARNTLTPRFTDFFTDL